LNLIKNAVVSIAFFIFANLIILVMNLLLASLAVFFLNIPFGMWRSKTKKFSWQWALSIHVPIPFVVALRFLFHLGFKWWTYPFLVGAFFLGQLSGKKIADYRKEKIKGTSDIKNSDKE